MQETNRYVIRVTPERCTGCLRCQLACSERYTGAFNPLEARILVDGSGLYSRIEFSDLCDQCGLCLTQCLYGALEKVEKEVDR